MDTPTAPEADLLRPDQDLRRRLALVLDVDDLVEARRLAQTLRPWFGVVKVGLELYLRYGPDVMRQAEKSLLLQVLDHVWKDHLLHLDHLRQGIYLRGYGQKDPLNEYKREAFDLFDALLVELRQMVTQVMMQLEVRIEPPPPPPSQFADAELDGPRGRPGGGVSALARNSAMAMAGAAGVEAGSMAIDPDDPSTWGRVSRNAPCPCGSGKKYKACHGSLV